MAQPSLGGRGWGAVEAENINYSFLIAQPTSFVHAARGTGPAARLAVAGLSQQLWGEGEILGHSCCFHLCLQLQLVLRLRLQPGSSGVLALCCEPQSSFPK